ncbi:hypothetical protein FG386_001330 [Cryptosporidium ryanae]|uniref:uncharacterized protein n=1 Tax=Cryptosporidium ryanae TaxID=515981 RepID=UPI00351A9A5A|nr:hypothetical protein FG386_001330 [Cryptosporidium ryanae]
MEVEIDEKIRKNELELDMSVGILDENDPDSARFMVLVRNAMEDLQQQVKVERSLYHKSREELSTIESKSRKLETELCLEKERNAQLVQELERLERFITEQNECNDVDNDKDNYWELYSEALKRIDELESTISNDKRNEDLDNRIIELTNEINSYKDVISEYKTENQKLKYDIDSIKESDKIRNIDRNEIIKEYEDKVQDLKEKLSIEKIENETVLDQLSCLQDNLAQIRVILETNNYSTVEEVIDNIKTKNDEIAFLKTKLDSLENSVHNCNEKEIEISEKEVYIASREMDLNNREENLNNLKDKLKDQENRINTRDRELEQRAKKISNLEKEILDKQREYEAYVDDLNVREQSFNKMVEDYSLNMEKTQKEQESNNMKREFEMEKALIELERRKNELEESRTKFEEYRKIEEEKIKQEANSIKKELESFKEELKKQELEFKSRNHEQEEFQNSLNQLKLELEDKEKVLAGKSRLLEEKENILNAKMVEESNALKQNNHHIENIRSSYEEKIRELEEKLCTKNNEIDNLKSNIEEEKKRYSLEHSRFELKLSELEARESSVNDLKNLLNAQKLDLENKQKEFDLYINELENRQKEFENFWLELDKRQKNISIKEKELESKELFLDTQRITLSESEKKSLSEKEELLFERENNLNKREQRFSERERTLVERENKLVQKEKGLLEKEMGLNDLEIEVTSLSRETKLVEEGLAVREAKVEEKEALNKNKESVIIKREKILTEREEDFVSRESEFRDRERIYDEKNRELAEREQELEEKELYLNEREKRLQLERGPIIDELIRIEEKNKQLFERELEIQRNEDILHEMEGILKSREKELLDEKISSSSKKEEIGELRRMIEDLEIKNKEMEKETHKTYQILQQQIKEEMKQKEDMLFTILHLHRQINQIMSLANTSEHSEAKVQYKNNNIPDTTSSEALNSTQNNKSLENGTQTANSQIMLSLEKTMNKLFEKLQATENREKNLLKELRQLTERNKISKLENNSAYSDSNKHVPSTYLGDNLKPSDKRDTIPNEKQILDRPSLSLTSKDGISDKHNILSTFTNNSPVLHPESPMVLMPLLTDIKNELNELKKSSESNIVRGSQTDEKTAFIATDTLSNNNLENHIGYSQLRLQCDGYTDVGMNNSNNIVQQRLLNRNLNQSQYSNIQLNSSMNAGCSGECGHIDAGVPKINSLVNNLRPSSGSVISNSNSLSKDSVRRMLEYELNSLRQWKKGMKQWDGELSTSSNRQEEVTAWKQFIDQQMQVIAKKLERRLSAALQK